MMDSPLEVVADLVLLLAIVLVAAKIGGEIFERFLKLPPVLGELGAGVLISPFALGGIEIGSFGPLFDMPFDTQVLDGVARQVESVLPIQPQLFFIAQIAAIVLLFGAGLETNRQQFFRYIRPGAAVAAGGVIVPFALGFGATVALGFADLASVEGALPALFVGAIVTATSVGITARVLADIRMLSSVEGTTILSAAVIDDILGIIVLAVIVGIKEDGPVTTMSIVVIFAKAVGFWLGLSIVGSLISGYISKLVTWFTSAGAVVVLALALAFIAAGVAEIYFGLAMIIGSYTMGLVLSDTELKHRIEEPMRQIGFFLVPVFFVVIGMQVDLTALGGGEGSHSMAKIVSFTIVLTVLAIISKLAGCGLPALLVGFNARGAWRIGLGMLPRGEVALIVAGIGLASGVIERDIFAVAIIMTVITTVISPIMLVPAFRGASGQRNPEKKSN